MLGRGKVLERLWLEAVLLIVRFVLLVDAPLGALLEARSCIIRSLIDISSPCLAIIRKWAVASYRRCLVKKSVYDIIFLDLFCQ